MDRERLKVFTTPALVRYHHFVLCCLYLFAEEKAYWDTNGKGPQPYHHALPPAARLGKPDQGFMSKLSATEIGTAYDNLTKTIGGQAKVLGDQAKTFGEQAKGYTLANTSTAAAAMNRFKKQIASAVDGVPMRPDDDQLREPGTTMGVQEKAGDAEQSQGLLQESKRECDEEEEAEGKGKEGVKNAQNPGLAGEEATAAPSSVTAAAPAAGADVKRVQVNGGMVDEGAPVLGFGAFTAAFKKKPAGGATVTQTHAVGGGGERNASSGAMTAQSDLSASGGGKGGGGGGGSRSGGDVGEAGLKILPRTASLVGGRQWAVVASVFDTTASVIDETVGDLFT